MNRFPTPALINRIRCTDKVTLLCAPPGYRKRETLLELAGNHAETGQALLIDGIDHKRDHKGAGDAVLVAENQALLLIADPLLCDGDFLVRAIERRAGAELSPKIVLAMDALDHLPIAGLRAKGALDIVGPKTLAISPREIREATKVVGLQSVRQRITQIAGDWPAALSLLVRFALESDSDVFGLPDADLLRASGLYDFINQRVFPLLSSVEQEVVARASLLSRADITLLRLAAREDRNFAAAAHKLQGLISRKNEQFSINQALRIFVVEHAATQDFEKFQGKILELAEQCASKNRLHDAARLAAEAGHPERIGAYAEEHGALLIWVLCGFSDVRALVDNAGAEVIEDSPVLRMMRCIVFLKMGNIHGAEIEFKRLAEDPEISGSMGKEIEIVRVTLLAYGCSLARENDLELFADLLAEQSSEPAWQTFLATLSCMLNSQRGRLNRARENLREARMHAERAGARYNLMFLHLHEAAIELAQGKPETARRLVANARKMWRSEFPDDVGVETVFSALSASIEFAFGRMTSARHALRKSAHRMPDAEAWFDIYFAAYEPYARIYLKDHDLAATLNMLAAEEANLEARGLGRIARLLGGLGDCLAGEARQRGEMVDHGFSADSQEENPVWSWQEQETYTLASTHLDISNGNFERAIEKLDAAKLSAIERELRRSVLRYEIQLFCIYKLCGNLEKAIKSLREVVVLGTASGASQIISDLVGPQLVEHAGELQRLRPFSEQEGQFMARARVRKTRRGISVSELSARETEVLSVLSDGGSDKQLARRLGISEHGVRYHLKNIFRKLEVHDRTSAIAIAHQNKLVRSPDPTNSSRID